MRNLPEDSFGLYKIYVEEELFPNWQQTFSEVSLRKVAGGTCIEVYCRDMSELHGVIHLIFNMGLNLQATKIHGFSWRI